MFKINRDMDARTIIQVILFGLALSADAFSVAVADGLIYKDINKKRCFFIAGVFGVFQGLFPLIGYWLVEGISQLVGSSAGAKAGVIMSTIVSWVAFALLLFIGGKMIFEGIKAIKTPPEEKKDKVFSYKEVLFMGVATAIDALAAGVAFHNGDLSNNVTIWLHISMIIVITFVISLVGVLFGKFFLKLFKGKTEITEIIGGSILILLAVWVILTHYLGI